MKLTNEIRHKINKRYKLFKAAVTKKCPELWQNYKQARNEVTAALRKAKASYFERMFGEVKKSSAYWKLNNKATSRIAHKKSIGPLRKEKLKFYRNLIKNFKSNVNNNMS